MNAVLVKSDCLFGDGQGSETGLGSPPAPEIVAAFKLLAEKGLFTLLITEGAGISGEEGRKAIQQAVEHIRVAGGRVDAVWGCSHAAGEHCTCWGEEPDLLFRAALEFNLELHKCYLIGYTLRDIQAAIAAGCRPILDLEGRAIDELVRWPKLDYQGYGRARNLQKAIEYVLAEEEIARSMGYPAARFAPLHHAEQLAREAAVLPSRRPVLSQRWLAPLVGGLVFLSLGIAYLLTHLYRTQPFPYFVWYLTLQFIPRPLRGVLFIAVGLTVVIVAIRGFVTANVKRNT